MQSHKELNAKEVSLKQRENAVAKLQQSIDTQTNHLTKVESSLQLREREMAERYNTQEQALKTRKEFLDHHDALLPRREQDLLEREASTGGYSLDNNALRDIFQNMYPGQLFEANLIISQVIYQRYQRGVIVIREGRQSD